VNQAPPADIADTSIDKALESSRVDADNPVEWQPRPCEGSWWQTRASRQEVVARLPGMFTDPASSRTRNATRRRGLNKLLDWLQSQPGDSWQERWLARDAAGSRAAALGLPQERARDFALAVSEVASNSIRHGGGRGLLRMWVQDGSLVCELSDAGYIADPLAGKLRPAERQIGGTGLWFTHQLCDLVQIRSTRENGTRVRLHAHLPGAPHT
jgi:anti-sigma regulatory factor (Ser/Thr protein kinase)